MQKFIVVVCALLVGAIGATAAVSAEDLAAAVKERRDLMKKTVAPAAKLGGQMIKGVKPYDAAEAAKAMNEINGVPDNRCAFFFSGTSPRSAGLLPLRDQRQPRSPRTSLPTAGSA